MLNILERISGVLDKISGVGGWIGCAALVSMLVLMDYMIWVRKIAHEGFFFGYEFLLVGLVIMVAIAASYTLREEGHVRVELLLEKMNPRLRNWFLFATSITAGLFCVVMVLESWFSVEDSLLWGELTMSAHMPMAIIKSAFMLGFFLLALQWFSQSYKYYRQAKALPSKQLRVNK